MTARLLIVDDDPQITSALARGLALHDYAAETENRADRALDEEPYTVAVIDLEQLERELPRTVPEAMDRIPGVLVQKTASGHGSPYIRGFTGNRRWVKLAGYRVYGQKFGDYGAVTLRRQHLVRDEWAQEN